MTIVAFGNRFKRMVTDPKRRADLNVAGIPNFFDNGHAYNRGECTEIDNWWDWMAGRGGSGVYQNWRRAGTIIGIFDPVTRPNDQRAGEYAGTLFNNYWDGDDFENHTNDLQVNHPDGVSAPLIGYNAILALGNKFVFFFRGVGGKAADPARINNANILNYYKCSPDDNLRLVGLRAGQIFNQGWDHTEIRIANDNDIEVTLNYGANWVGGAFPHINSKTNFLQTEVRNNPGYLATGIPANRVGDLIINQYFNSGLNAADIIAAYGQGWIHGTEVRRNPVGGAREVSHDGGNTWTAWDWSAVAAAGAGPRNDADAFAVGGTLNGVIGALDADALAKIAAYQSDGELPTEILP